MELAGIVYIINREDNTMKMEHKTFAAEVGE
jgi:hypothetical protein